MKVLVIGGGGREHAIVHTLKKSPKVDYIWCAPGNGGIAAEAECVAIKATDIDGMVAFAKEHKPDLVMVAPDDPLALGMVDALEAAGIRAFGPRKNAAIIEGSKVFSKDLMKKYNISAGNVLRHYDLTGKYCPWYYVDENRWAVLHEYITSAAVKPKKLYRVQVGAFSSRENAEQYMNKVKAAGFGAFIVEVDNNA